MRAEFIGTLNQRILIERPSEVRTSAGLRQDAWEAVATCFAAVSLEGAGAESEGMALSALPRLRVTLRMREGVAVDQRVRWQGRTLMVRQVLADPRTPDRLTLRCEEVRA